MSPGSNSSLPAHLGQGAGWARLNRLKVEETGDVGKLEIQTERDRANFSLMEFPGFSFWKHSLDCDLVL